MAYTNQPSILNCSITDIPQLRNRNRVFRNHQHAAEALATLLESHQHTDTLILGIANSGIPLAVTLAETLGLGSDIAVTKKLTFPWDKHTAYGAVAFDGSVYLNEEVISHSRLDQTAVTKSILENHEKVRLEQPQNRYGFSELADRNIILVDDGIATGATMQATIQALRKQNVKKIIIAAATGCQNSLNRLAALTDKLYCANIRDDFPFTIGDAYQIETDISIIDAFNSLTKQWPENKLPDNTSRPDPLPKQGIYHEHS